MKKIILMAVLSAALTGSVFAQSLPTPVGFESPTSQATAGVFSSAADDYIRPDSFSNVEFENWFGFTSFASGSGLRLGYATKIGSLYFGAFYGGTLWAGVQTFNYTEGNAMWFGELRGGVRSYTTAPIFTTTPRNQLAVLVGLPGMGFRLSFYSTHQSFSDKDFIAGGDDYFSYSTERGLISPQLAWSLSNNLIDAGIKPWVTVDLDFNRDITRAQTYFPENGQYVSSDEYIIGDPDNYFQPVIALGLGGFTFATKGNFSASIDLIYRLTIRAYENEYNYDVDTNGRTQIGKIKGYYETNAGDTSYYEADRIINKVSPSVSGSWEDEKLKLGFTLTLNLEFGNANRTEVKLKSDYSGNYWRDGPDRTTSTFSFNPELTLGAQWLIGSKLIINAGGTLDFNAFTSTTVSGNTYLLGDEVANSSSKTVSTSFANSISNALSVGVTLNATDNLTFDASSGIRSGNIIDVFNGLLIFGNLLVSLKF